jgi:hypothetical protein
MKSFAHRIVSSLFAAVSIAMLLSCSDNPIDGGTTTTTDTGTGTVGVLLTDKPADTTIFESINASIEKIELLGGDQNSVVLYSGPTKTYDLLRLKNESVPFTFKDNVPVGSYCKIRLILTDVELVLADETPNDASDNETYHPQLPGNGKLDLVARDCFDVGPGETVMLQLDVDGGNSIHTVANGYGYNFRPVVFVDVLSWGFDARLVRLEGEITGIDIHQNALLLCDAIPTWETNSRGCVDVYLGDEAAYFDNADYAGTPRPMAELLSEDKIGKRVAVVGWPRFSVPPYVDVDIPYGHLPPPGECKLWYIDLEPGLQGPPGDCEELFRSVTDNTVLVTHEGVVHDEHYVWMAVDALVVELGRFLQIAGNVATDADTTGFDMTVSSGSAVITGDALAVAFQPGDVGVNGTRIVSKAGELLQPSQVTTPLPVQVDGTLEFATSGNSILRAALVILDTTDLGGEQVTGTLLAVSPDNVALVPEADTVCGVATSELFVTLTPDVDILTVTITTSGSEIVPGGVLIPGQTVGMNGHCEANAYVTDNIVIVDDQRL